MHTNDIARYQHPHFFHYSGVESERRTIQVVALTVTMMVVEIIAGWTFNSMALLADGWHMSTHAAALGISWLAFVLARRYAFDRHFVFGTWKIEILGGFVSAILLGGVAVAMAAVSVARLFHPVTIQFNQAIIVAVIGLAVNLISMSLLRDRQPHDHAHQAHGHNHAHANLNLRAAYLHVIADALTSVLAIAALLGGKYMNWTWLDPVMGIVGAVMIANWTRSLLLETGGILLDREGDDGIAREIHAAIEIDADTRISDLHVWRVGGGKYACILAVVSKTPQAPETYKARLKRVHELAHVTVEPSLCEDSIPPA
jgi:cation diffusion facilitator family transporter